MSEKSNEKVKWKQKVPLKKEVQHQADVNKPEIKSLLSDSPIRAQMLVS